MTPPTSRRLSCKRCQFRKLRCSRTEPCQSCVNAHHVCEYRDDDRKRRPASQEYVASLENRVAWLESFLKRLKAAAPQGRNSMLEAISFDSHLLPSSSETSSAGQLRASAGDNNTRHADQQLLQQGHLPAQHRQSRLRFEPEGSLIYHGATSIHRAQNDQLGAHQNLWGGPSYGEGSGKDGAPQVLAPMQSGSDTNFDYVAGHFGIDLKDDVTTNAMLQFFRWQYPHFMFIYREAFLREHFSSHCHCKYWSLALLLSVCALGALMSPENSEKELGEKYFAAAESILIVSGLTHPSITTVQAFLCLAFYEIGRGNLSKGWGFSGIAFRMAQDLGFQKDPKQWISQDASLVTSEDIEIRRRIYWGCYNSDKVISLILGRPVQLYYAEAEVELMNKLPDFPNMDAWLPAGVPRFDEHIPGTTDSCRTLVPCFNEQIRLSRIIETTLSSIFSSGSNLDDLTRSRLGSNLEVELCHWFELLPASARWNKWEPSASQLVPSVAALQYVLGNSIFPTPFSLERKRLTRLLSMLFQSARIALHFDQAKSSPTSGPFEGGPSAVCATAAEEIAILVRHYRSRHGLEHAPVIFIYGMVQAMRALRLLKCVPAEEAYLLAMLDECCSTWRLARQAKYNMNL